MLLWFPVTSAKKDGEAFCTGNKAADTRLRNALQRIKVAATDIRKDVTEKKNEGK